MDFSVTLPLSLRDTCVNAIGVSLWTCDYVVAVIKQMEETNFYSFEQLDIWDKLFTQIRRQIELSSLPSELKDKFYEIVIPIACQIRTWHFKLSQHKLPVIYVAEKYASRMVWLPQGGLDFNKMMLMLLNDEGIEAHVRLRLACYYGGGSDILRALWLKIEPADFHGKDLNVIMERESIIVAYRLHAVNRRLPDLAAFYRSKYPESSLALKLMTEEQFYHTGSGVVRGIWSMLDYDEKIEALTLINPHCVGDVILNLLKDISFNDLVHLYPEDIPLFLLKWPQRVHFKRVLPLLMKHFTENDHYIMLLRYIFSRLLYEKLDRFYEDLPRFVWNEIPLSKRKELLSNQDHSMSDIICSLSGSFMRQDILRLMLEDASTVQKRNLLSGHCFSFLLENLDLDACEVLLKETIKTKEDFEVFGNLRFNISINTMLELGKIVTRIQLGLN